MRVTPKSEEECKSSELLSPGEYDAEVMTAEEKQSKSGNDMIAMRLKVYGDNGAEASVFDYLLDAVAYKVRHFAEAAGMIDAYERGELYAEDLVGKVVRVKLKIEHDKTGNYADKNAVQDYIVQAPAPKPAPARVGNIHQNASNPRQASTQAAMRESVNRQTRGRSGPVDAGMRTVPADTQPPIADSDIPF
jgi:hypothetical protein